MITNFLLRSRSMRRDWPYILVVPTDPALVLGQREMILPGSGAVSHFDSRILEKAHAYGPKTPGGM